MSSGLKSHNRLSPRTTNPHSHRRTHLGDKLLKYGAVLRKGVCRSQSADGRVVGTHVCACADGLVEERN